MIDLWNRALGAEFPMTERLWWQNIEHDPNYALGDALIVRDHAGAVVGLALTRRLRQCDAANMADMTRLSDLGWILALIVAPSAQGQGLGGKLLTLAEKRLRDGGASRYDLGGGLGHFLPGPPQSNVRALAF